VRRASAKRNEDLHGNVPDSSRTVLLLVDVINGLDFPGNEALLGKATALGTNIAALRRRCRRTGIPTIYVNDDRGCWRSDFPGVLRHCLRRQSPGRDFVKMLVPKSEDYIVLKPKHSAFYATPLDTLLSYIQAKTVVLAGLTTNACVLGTAVELYIRDFEIVVPSDCVCAISKADHERALAVMKTSFGARVCTSEELKRKDFKR
jgi:nicotinamidase-related amidase